MGTSVMTPSVETHMQKGESQEAQSQTKTTDNQ